MAVFEHSSILLELKTLPFKERKKLKSLVTENGGSISYVVNKQCTLIVTGDVADLSSNRLRGIQRHQTPVVGVDYVYGCLERGVLLPVDDYKLDASSPSGSSSPPLPPSSPTPAPITRQAFKAPAAEPTKGPAKVPAEPVDSVAPSQTAESGNVLEKYRIYTETDSDLPTYPDRFQVAKYSIFEKINSNTWCVLELQSHKGEEGWKYRVVKYWKDDISTEKEAARDTLVFLSTSEEALEVYKSLRETLQAAGMQPRTDAPPQAPHLGSAPLQQLLLEEKLNTGSLSREVGVFVELLWTEALGLLCNVLRVPIDKLSLNDVSRVEGLLLLAQRKFRENNDAAAGSLLDEVYTLLLHVVPFQHPPTAKLISQKLDLCQLIRDVLNVSEMTLGSPASSSLGKYRALRCSIETVPPDTPEFQAVTALLQHRRVQVQQVLRVSRGVELQTFRGELGNIKPLLHSSSPSNFVGVLSRGLLLPRVGVEHHGIERTDVGNLGSGIYFSDAVSTCLKYSKPSETDGSRLLLVCDVALGRCRDLRKRDVSLTRAPEGHHSAHGVRRTRGAPSEFEDDEYVVYSPDQVKLKYVVQFSIEGDQPKEFSPAVDTSAKPAPPFSDQGRGLMLEDDEVESIKDPLADVKAGLLDGSGQQLPLQAVHVKCKLMDLLSQVVIFQKYANLSSAPIEAKYVFPLDDSAAVCGFEAFINGKHVVGKVKEKETARREYKQAVEKGHGAYLMDQDAPDVFTISVGNLPPGATVLIKVTFVCELIVRDGSVLFSLPGSVAPWQESAALNQTTQVTVEKVCVTDEAREFTLDMSVEMPNKITNLQCITHKVKIKRTDCKAVVSVLPGEVMGQDGFQLSITLSEVHLPRMWVEKHPHKDSQASMLVFYPDFEADSASACDEVVLLVDTSESMKGEPLRTARRIARQVLGTLGHDIRLNVVFFGTDHTEAFLTARPLAEARPAAERFIKLSSPAGGSTELWRPLRALSLLPPSRGVRNLLLLSDGHVQNAELALRLLRDNARHSRLFACGLGPTANRHMLRALAQAGGGAFEYFDTKTKHTWAEKVARQVKRMASPGCSSVSVKWQQFDPTAPPPEQAPKQLHALFNDCHTLVYGFVPHCTQATLLGNLSGQELKTMVSTSELQKTRGTFLHKLTARALIRDYEDGSLDSNEAEHEGKKAELKRSIIELSKEFSILSQFTSFVAVEERDSAQTEEGFTDVPKLISEEDVDFLPYVSWIPPPHSEEGAPMDEEGSMDEDEEESMDEDEEGLQCIMMEEVEERSLRPRSKLVGKVKRRSRLSRSMQMEELEKHSLRRCSLLDDDDDDDDDDGDEMGQCVEDRSLSMLMEGSFSASDEDDDDDDEDDDDDWEECVEGRSLSMRGRRVPQIETVSASSCDTATEMKHRTISPRYSPTSASSSSMTMSLVGKSKSGPERDGVTWAGSGIGALPAKEKMYMRPPGSAPPPPPPPPPFQGLKGQPQLLGLSFHSLAPPPPPPYQGSPLTNSGPVLSLARLGLQRISQPESSGLFGSAAPLCSTMGDIGAFQSAKMPLSLHKKKRSLSSLPEPVSLPMPSVREAGSEDASSVPVPTDDILTFAGSTFSYQQSDQSLLPQFTQRRQEARAFLTQQSSGFGFGGSLPQDQSSEHLPILAPQSSGFGFGGSLPQDQSSEHLPILAPQSSGFCFGGSLPQVQSSEYRPMKVDDAFARPLQDDSSSMSVMAFIKSTAEPLSHRSPAGVVRDSGYLKERSFQGRRPPVRLEAEQAVAEQPRFKRRSLGSTSMRKSPDPEGLRLKWTKIFQMQHSEGYWELTTELGELMNVNVDLFANVFLKNKGIQSLGVKAHADILRLVATLLVLQMMREEKLEEGKLLRTLFSLDESSLPRPARWAELKRAVDWVCWADRQYPCVYSRLEFGRSWETSTRQLLGFEGLPPFSALAGLKLQETVRHLLAL